MKRVPALIVALVMLLAMAVPSLAASDITGSLYQARITITNSGDAVTGVAVASTNISTPGLVSGGFANATLSNLALRNAAGADVAFMPGYDTNPWIMYVPAMGGNSATNYNLFMAESTGGKMAYFPGDEGLTTNDKAALELGGNFEIELSELYIDPTRKGYILNKSGAIALYTLQGQLFAGINPTSGTKNSYYNQSTIMAVYGGIRRGNYFDDFAMPSIITSGTLYLYKTGSPTGTAYYRIYNAGDGSLLGTIGEIDVTTLTTTPTVKRFDTNSVLVPAGTNIYAVIEFNGGDASNCVNTSRHVSSSYGSYAPVTYTAGTWSIDIGTADITQIGYISAAASLLTTALTGEHTLKLYADGVNFGIDIDGVNQAAIAWSGNVTNNTNNYTWFADDSVPYVRELKVTINSVLQQHLVYQYAETPVVDISGQDNQPASVSVRTTSSDADVSATMTLFQPVSEAKAPQSDLGESPDWYELEEMPGEFKSETEPTIPGAAVIKALSDATSTPAQLPLTIIAGFAILALSLLVSAMMRDSGPTSMLIKGVLICCLMGFCIAVSVFDWWMLICFIFIALAWATASQRGWT